MALSHANRKILKSPAVVGVVVGEEREFIGHLLANNRPVGDNHVRQSRLGH